MRRRFDRSIDLDFIITKALFCSPIVRLRGSAQHFPVSAGQDRSPSLSFALVFLPRRFPSLNFCTRLLFGSKKKKHPCGESFSFLPFITYAAHLADVRACRSIRGKIRCGPDSIFFFFKFNSPEKKGGCLLLFSSCVPGVV